MKRNLLIGLLLLAAGSFNLHAQKTALSPAAQEINLQNFWFNSTNAAGLAISPLASYSDVSIRYDREQGAFKRAHEAQSKGEVTAAASGALTFKGFNLYGDFSYINSFSKGCLYNANLYEPSFRMPYYLADWNLSDWKRQSYDMGFKAVAPKMANDRLAIGLTMRYCDKVGAKQMDPRAVSYLLKMQVAPSIAYALSPRSTIGLTIDYERYKERTSQSCQNYLVEQPVALMRGLGYYTAASVGGNMGVADLLYSGHRIGGAVTFENKGTAADFFAEAAGGYNKITVMEQPRFPRMRGATSEIFANLSLKGNFGESRNHRVAIAGGYSHITGSEYTQELVTSPKRMWQTLAITPMSTYDFINGSICYDFYNKITDYGYDWEVGAEVDFNKMDQVYMLSVFNNMNVDADLHFAYNFSFTGGSNLLTNVSAGYYMPLGGNYMYTGPNNQDSEIVTGLYPKELAYLTTQCVHAAAGATYSFPINKRRNNLYITAEAQYRKPLGVEGNRLLAALAVGMLF